MREPSEAELVERSTTAAAAGFPGATIGRPRRLEGGLSSLTYAATFSRPSAPPEEIVLKVAPPGLAPVRHRDVLRQARVLRALAPVDGVPVPTVLFEDAAPPPLFAMSFVPGESYEPNLDVSGAPPSAQTVERRAAAAAHALASMQRAVPADVGLAAEPPLELGEELERWSRLISTCDGDLRPSGEAELRERLAARLPAEMDARVVHGDYRLANMQFDGEELGAIIDWEIWSIGDPRIDLAWLLMHTEPVHRFATDRDAANQRAGLGMQDPEALLAEYASVAPPPLEDLDWFLALAFYKCASTIAALAKFNRRSPSPDPSLEIGVGTLPALFRAGLETLASGRLARTVGA